MSIQKQLKRILMDEKLRETTSLRVEIMNSKRQVKGKLGNVVQISRLPLDVSTNRLLKTKDTKHFKFGSVMA